jgi:hypothetical protein
VAKVSRLAALFAVAFGTLAGQLGGSLAAG